MNIRFFQKRLCKYTSVEVLAVPNSVPAAALTILGISAFFDKFSNFYINEVNIETICNQQDVRRVKRSQEEYFARSYFEKDFQACFCTMCLFVNRHKSP